MITVHLFLDDYTRYHRFFSQQNSHLPTRDILEIIKSLTSSVRYNFNDILAGRFISFARLFLHNLKRFSLIAI